jgi:hypothetical protein
MDRCNIPAWKMARPESNDVVKLGEKNVNFVKSQCACTWWRRALAFIQGQGAGNSSSYSLPQTSTCSQFRPRFTMAAVAEMEGVCATRGGCTTCGTVHFPVPLASFAPLDHLSIIITAITMANPPCPQTQGLFCGLRLVERGQPEAGRRRAQVHGQLSQAPQIQRPTGASVGAWPRGSSVARTVANEGPVLGATL